MVTGRSEGVAAGKIPRSPVAAASSAALSQQLPETRTPESTTPHTPRETAIFVNLGKFRPAIIVLAPFI